MTDSSQFAEFAIKAKENLDQIKSSLLRHDRNPKDREFLNDISKSIKSIKKTATPLELSSTAELCDELDILINLIRDEKKELHQEIIIIFAMCRDRLNKLAFELETVQEERSKVKDLVNKIQEQIDNYNKPEDTEEKVNQEPSDTSDKPSEQSLLPEEIVNKEYDEELFQIYIEQLQENLSLIRSLNDSFEEQTNKSTLINQCSDLVGKLQSSANYMGYDRLAEFYLQWVAELEMVGVDLAMGSAISFDFMDEKIKKIADLFPEVEDIPADTEAVIRVQQRSAHHHDTKEPEDVKKHEEPEDIVSVGALDGVVEDDTEFIAALSTSESLQREEAEPIAALADESPAEEAFPEAIPESDSPTPSKKEPRGKKTIEIDSSFLEEEQQSEEYDEELFQIFVQQLQENLSQLRELTDNFPEAENKSHVINQCSNLVGKLQSSANYMGYERLAEYYLQWVAELEMAGVELSIGSEVTFEFMVEKIDSISRLFLEEKKSTPASPEKAAPEKTVSPPEPKQEVISAPETPEPKAEPETSESQPEEDEETLSFDDGEMDGSDFDFSDAGEMKLGSLFANIKETEEDDKELEDSFEEIAGLRAEIKEEEEAPLPDEEYDDIHYDDEEEEEEELSSGVEPIAGRSDKGFLDKVDVEAAPPLEERLREGSKVGDDSGDKSFGEEFADALDIKLEKFFKDIGEPEESDDMEESFMEIASLSDDLEEQVPDMESVAAIGEFSDQDERTPDEAGKVPADDIHDEVSALFEESLDEDISEPEQAKEQISESEITDEVAGRFEDESASVQTEKPETDFAGAVDEQMEGFFADIEEQETTEESAASEGDTIAALADEVAGLFEDEPTASTQEPEEDFTGAVDEHMEDFFTDIEEPESAEEMEGPAEAIAAFADEDIPSKEPIAEEIIEEVPVTDEVAGLFEDEPAADQGEEPEEEFTGVVDEKMEDFFANLEEPEEEDKEKPDEAVAALTGVETFEEEPSLDEEVEIEPATEETKGDFKEAVDEKMDDLFADFDETETTEVSEEPEETIAELTETEATVAGVDEDLFDEEVKTEKAIEEPGEEFAETDDEKTEDFFVDVEEHETPEESEEPLAKIPEDSSDDLSALLEEDSVSPDQEAQDATPETDEILSDEELLREIEGPTVGGEFAEDTESLLPDFGATEEAISALSDEELSDEELFEKLEGAVSADEMQPQDTEDIFDEHEETAEILETAPERKELYQKLTDALHDLDDEAGLPEDVDETETVEQDQEIDSGLFEMLSTALETPDVTSTIGEKAYDDVLEEIFSGPVAEPEKEKPVADLAPKKLTASEIKQIIHMDSNKVDSLLDQFGELNANRSTLAHLLVEMKSLHQHYQEIEGFSKHELKPLKDLIFKLGDTSVSLTRVSNELREGIIQVRMVPISLLFERYHEFVENLATRLNKKVEIEIVGEDTELEKIVLDEISEPLTHLISNAVEHGIETIDERNRLGKNDTGNIRLEAYQQDNEIVIEIMDDGQGIDFGQVKTRAIELDLFKGDELYQMAEQDLKEIVMNPAFSFSDGRGEGLNIVKSNIDNIHGSVDIRSSAGKGTIIQVKVPFSLLIVKALKVNVGNEIMALPVTGIEEIIRVSQDKVLEEDGKQLIEIHEEKIPLYSLSTTFNIEPTETTEDRLNIVIVSSRARTVGLIVDSTAGLEEIIIKPLGETLRKKSGFAGATIISDGEISLVPDIDEIISIAGRQQQKNEESIS